MGLALPYIWESVVCAHYYIWILQLCCHNLHWTHSGCAGSQADYQFYSGTCFSSLLQFLYLQITEEHSLTFIFPIKSILCRNNRTKPNMPTACMCLARLCMVCMANIQKSNSRFQNSNICFKILFVPSCVYVGKEKREVVIGILTFQLSENNNFILRREHKILSDHTKV